MLLSLAYNSKGEKEKMKLSPEDCASMISTSVRLNAEDKGKKITRFQLSIKALSKISGKKVIDQLYLDSLSSEIQDLGWCMFRVENTKFAFIQSASVANWVKFSSTSIG